jgi:hypothetical protein
VKPGQGALRTGRVLTFAVSSMALASAAHVAAGGDVPLLGMLLSLPLVVVAVNPLAGRPRGLLTLGAAMAGVQAMLHVAFLAADSHGACAQISAHGHPTAVRCADMTGMPPSTGMLAAHVLAASALVVLLARGEAALWALADRVAFRVRRFLAAVTTPGAGSPPSALLFLVVPQLRDRPGRAQTKRGPPVAAAA